MSAELSSHELQNRWRHAPTLHPFQAGRRASWLEIFFDIVLAGAIGMTGAALGERTTPGAFMPFALEAGALFFCWTGFTFYQNRFFVDDLFHRLLVASMMLAVTLCGTSAARVFGGDSREFSLACAAIDVALAIMYARTYVSIPGARPLTRHHGTTYAIGAAIWLAAAVAPARWVFSLWCAGVGVGFSFPLSRRSRELTTELPPDPRHLGQRYGLVTSVVLGLNLLWVLQDLPNGNLSSLSGAALVLVVFCSLWWLYFDDAARSNVRGERAAPFVWLNAHLPLLLGFTTVAAGLRRLSHANTNADTDGSVRGLLAGGLFLTFFALALVDSVTERRTDELGDRARVNARIVAALLSLLLYPLGAVFGPLGLLALAAVPCVVQVAFDLMMAPLASAYAQVAEETANEMEARRNRLLAGTEGAVRRTRVGEAVRKGAPSELRSDFYFFFMEGPWSRLVLSLVFGYLTINATFAGLYLLEPGAINGAHHRSFGDAFFFSVQTFSTIGYGVLTPATPYGNLVVTAEAAVGLLSSAFATGLMFAKAARPHSSTLFSNVFVVSTRNGKPTLTFRVGNARGNDVVDATVTVTVLKDETSREGEHMRRMHELSLVRNRSPIFTMTWVVMHEINEHSPLADVDWSNPKDVIAVIVTLVGHDGTYGQTTYARHLYYPESARVGHRFVDVMALLPDGRMSIDYSRFHETLPDSEFSASLAPEGSG